MSNQITLPIILSDRKNQIEIKDTTLSGLEVVQFRNLIAIYYQLLTSIQEQSVASQDDNELRITAKAQVIKEKRKVLEDATNEETKAALAITDTRTRESRIKRINDNYDDKLAKLIEETNKIQSEIEEHQSAIFATTETMLKAIQKRAKTQADYDLVDQEFQVKKVQQEQAMTKLICEFLEPTHAKNFDFSKLSAATPKLLIEAVLMNKENDCNEVFTKWLVLKSPVAQPIPN